MNDLNELRDNLEEGKIQPIEGVDLKKEIIDVNIESLLKEFNEGKEVGENAGIPGDMETRYTWKRTFLQCFTGWPNDGKTTFFMFLALIKSLKDGWKWCIWSPEMLSSEKRDGKIYRNANDLIDELVYMLTGKCPYKHYQQLYKLPQMPVEEYKKAVDFIREHFVFVHPQEKTFDHLIDLYLKIYNDKNIDGFLIDPFKNIRQDKFGRSDQILDEAFDRFKDFAIDTNSSMNFIAHPKSLSDQKEKDGPFKVVDQFMLLGGAAWDNGLDGIYSVYRPFRHESVTDPNVEFYSLKKRKQQLTGKRGVVKEIKFNIKTNRYYFDDICPIDGSRNPETIEIKHEQQSMFSFDALSGSEQKAPF